MHYKGYFLFFLVSALVVGGCGINSVTKAELESVKAGNVITYRYRKGDKEWFYADKIVRVEGDKPDIRVALPIRAPVGDRPRHPCCKDKQDEHATRNS